jgi:hypothetical protein
VTETQAWFLVGVALVALVASIGVTIKLVRMNRRRS